MTTTRELQQVSNHGNVLDTNVSPIVGEELQVVIHDQTGRQKFERKGSALLINEEKVEIFLSEFQRVNLKLPGDAPRKRGMIWVEGNKLRQHLEKKSMVMLNATSLDFLLAHQEFIPDCWKSQDSQGKRMDIFFWGTIYRVLSGNLLVRFMCWNKSCWSSDFVDIDSHIRGPAALLDPRNRLS